MSLLSITSSFQCLFIAVALSKLPHAHHHIQLYNNVQFSSHGQFITKAHSMTSSSQ